MNKISHSKTRLLTGPAFYCLPNLASRDSVWDWLSLGCDLQYFYSGNLRQKWKRLLSGHFNINAHISVQVPCVIIFCNVVFVTLYSISCSPCWTWPKIVSPFELLRTFSIVFDPSFLKKNTLLISHEAVLCWLIKFFILKIINLESQLKQRGKSNH